MTSSKKATAKSTVNEQSFFDRVAPEKKKDFTSSEKKAAVEKAFALEKEAAALKAAGKKSRPNSIAADNLTEMFDKLSLQINK